MRDTTEAVIEYFDGISEAALNFSGDFALTTVQRVMRGLRESCGSGPIEINERVLSSAMFAAAAIAYTLFEESAFPEDIARMRQRVGGLLIIDGQPNFGTISANVEEGSGFYADSNQN